MLKYAALTLAMAGLVVGGWFAGRSYPDLVDIDALSSSKKDTKPTATPAPTKIFARGEIVPSGGVRNIYTLPGLRIKKILVQSDQAVTANQTELATFQSQDTLQLQKDLAAAKKEDTQKELKQRSVQAASHLATAEAALAAANLRNKQAVESSLPKHLEKKLKQAEKELQELKKLAADPDTKLLVSQNRLDQLQLGIETSKEELEIAKENAQNLKQSAALAVKTATAGLKAAKEAKAAIDSLKEASKSLDLGVDIANRQLESSRLLSPASGTVIKILAKEGDITPSAPIMQIADLSKMVCIAEVVDRLVPKVITGSRVVIKSPAFEKSLTGKVVEVGRAVGAAGIPNPNPLAPSARQTVKVRIEIDPKDSLAASNLLFLQVDVEIELAGSKVGSLGSAGPKTEKLGDTKKLGDD